MWKKNLPGDSIFGFPVKSHCIAQKVMSAGFLKLRGYNLDLECQLVLTFAGVTGQEPA
jgi:hypothetical protein